MKRTNNDTAVKRDNIHSDIWKDLREKGISWLTKLFNGIMRSKRMFDGWRIRTLIPIYKNKRDTQSCANYNGLSS